MCTTCVPVRRADVGTPSRLGAYRNSVPSLLIWWIPFRSSAAQSNVVMEGFRSLRQGEQVEFEVEATEGSQQQAVRVCGPDGVPPLVSRDPKLTVGFLPQPRIARVELFLLGSKPHPGRQFLKRGMVARCACHVHALT